MDAEAMLGAVLRGVVGGGGRKGRRRTLRHLSDGRHSWLTARNLLAAAGVAWGVYEVATRRSSSTQPHGGAGAETAKPRLTPPLVPAGPASPPPIPGAPAPASAADVPEGAVRLVRLALSAARADGQLSDTERELILSHAREAGAESIVERELANPQPLPRIVEGVQLPALRADLYRLAYAIVRADEEIRGGERIYLARLAQLLDLDAVATGRLEAEVAEGIDTE